MKNRFLLPIVVILVLAGGVTGVLVSRHNSDTAPTTAVSATPVDVATVQGQAGKTALQLLEAKYTVVTKTYSFGEEVTTINGRAADSTHYWEFQVNGVDASVGAGAYQSKDGEQLSFKYASL